MNGTIHKSPTVNRTRRWKRGISRVPVLANVTVADERRVHLGRQMLDEVFGPEWIEKIHWEELNMNSERWDILGQLFLAYASAEQIAKAEADTSSGAPYYSNACRYHLTPLFYLEEVNYGLGLFDSVGLLARLRELGNMWRREVGR